MADAASQAGDADSSLAPGLTSGLRGSVNVHRGALLLVPQCQCISSFIFYISASDSWWNMGPSKRTPVQTLLIIVITPSDTCPCLILDLHILYLLRPILFISLSRFSGLLI